MEKGKRDWKESRDWLTADLRQGPRPALQGAAESTTQAACSIDLVVRYLPCPGPVHRCSQERSTHAQGQPGQRGSSTQDGAAKTPSRARSSSSHPSPSGRVESGPLCTAATHSENRPTTACWSALIQTSPHGTTPPTPSSGKRCAITHTFGAAHWSPAVRAGKHGHGQQGPARHTKQAWLGPFEPATSLGWMETMMYMTWLRVSLVARPSCPASGWPWGMASCGASHPSTARLRGGAGAAEAMRALVPCLGSCRRAAAGCLGEGQPTMVGEH